MRERTRTIQGTESAFDQHSSEFGLSDILPLIKGKLNSLFFHYFYNFKDFKDFKETFTDTSLAYWPKANGRLA